MHDGWLLAMIAITPHMRILVARAPLDFRRGIDGTAAFCQQALSEDPMTGAVFVFRNRSATMIRILVYDGQGYWLMTKRLSAERFRHWCSKAKDGDSRPSDGIGPTQLQALVMGADWSKITTAALFRPVDA